MFATYSIPILNRFLPNTQVEAGVEYTSMCSTNIGSASGTKHCGLVTVDPSLREKNGSGDANGEQAIHCMMVSKIGSSVRIERFRERQ